MVFCLERRWIFQKAVFFLFVEDLLPRKRTAGTLKDHPEFRRKIIFQTSFSVKKCPTFKLLGVIYIFGKKNIEKESSKVLPFHGPFHGLAKLGIQRLWLQRPDLGWLAWHVFFSDVHPKQTNMTMEKQPWMKMYLLWKMLVFQPAMLVFRGCTMENKLG